MEMHDAWFFIGVFVFIFLIWVATGGPLHPLSFTGPSLAQPDVLGGGTYLQFPRAFFNVGESHVALPGSSSGGSSYGDSSISISSSLDGIAFGSPSSYRTIVSMSNYVSHASSSDPRNEYVQLSVSPNAGVPIDISGWQLVSEATGKAAAIPMGTRVPTSGIVNPQQDIVLAPGEHAILVSGRSPTGTSFRENKCIGYFGTFQQFSPSLPQNCPAPSDELVSFYGDYYVRDATCIDYVDRLSRCQTVLFPPRTLSVACRNFVVQRLNYNGCVSAHRNDPDFDGTTWRIYLGRDKHLWRARYEIVKLFDINKKTVDAFSY
ncbi:hypothetical protein A3I46_02720 [Candidatus Kaiserbacteria bacterium RIFCSPLOWO2_02_FULL_54_13]|uniref:LTD domain-containing protein n=1 Tax=Candidatus Kaiserbacteria bacterium RIFCSPHIGHO2_02_FULL_54_22 TaxID=1798495 RepID=A0A1F6DN13_9BACT|nr:MAG: hypothetical protein UY91_C0041G0001 [Parcubacteria group bacterium GW2011_GWB1_55_9]OGG62818.1 MAG: hypothetical protein A3C19_03695 [Candidatus Kaiserbacteria bacterium RIFCSPHIGHO2_02_FULL_54_22]OGG83855.1 MAG: hypothetical protein A3I46_02720 [Candidatus Kaiserbacteria bacterium RIFCSPLOWO2_02_FULL_54_13]OGG90161.1 MAG: hypothetical protein A3G12_03265 [Candidatus Kaiserbacteria bacterium RIFCSPLOWO2_12_FULL_54_10]